MNMLKVESKVKHSSIKSCKVFMIASFSMFTFSVFSGITKADNLNDALKCMVNFSEIQNNVTYQNKFLEVFNRVVKLVSDGMTTRKDSAKLMIEKKKRFDKYFSQKDFRFLLINSVWSVFLAGMGHLLKDFDTVIDVRSIKDFPSSSYRLEVLIGIGGLNLLKILQKCNCCNKFWSIVILALSEELDINDNEFSFENIKTIIVNLVTNLEKILK